MIRQNTERGAVVIGSNVYTNIAGVAASNCFGVKGMAIRSMTDGLVHLLRKVRYVVHKCTGTQVRAVNVYIDSMMIG